VNPPTAATFTDLPIVLLPGLGCDARLYAPHRRCLPVVVPPWLPPTSPRESLTSYAARMAAALPVRGRFILGGSSFGGMLAWEMAQHCRPEALALIGGATTPHELRWWLHQQARMARYLPLGAVRLIQPWVGPLTRVTGLTDGGGQPLIAAMVGTCAPGFLRWCAAAVGSWRPSPARPVPCLRLHGEADVAIPPPPPGPGITRVPRAGHMLDGSHAAVVIAWLRRIRAGMIRARTAAGDGRDAAHTAATTGLRSTRRRPN